jgi:hypothetical protein
LHAGFCWDLLGFMAGYSLCRVCTCLVFLGPDRPNQTLLPLGVLVLGHAGNSDRSRALANSNRGESLSVSDTGALSGDGHPTGNRQRCSASGATLGGGLRMDAAADIAGESEYSGAAPEFPDQPAMPPAIVGGVDVPSAVDFRRSPWCPRLPLPWGIHRCHVAGGRRSDRALPAWTAGRPTSTPLASKEVPFPGFDDASLLFGEVGRVFEIGEPLRWQCRCEGEKLSGLV